MRTKRELDECEYGAWVKIRVEKCQWARQFSSGGPPKSSVYENRHHF